MTTDKIRAAAQALHDIVMKQCGGYTSGPGFEAAELARALRAALAEPTRAERMREAGYTRRPSLREFSSDAAEPAQAAPAGDTVPVVAQVSTAVSLRPGRPPELLWFGPDIGLQPADYPVSQRDHLAAMEALRKENERLKADRSAQVAGVMRLVDEAMRYSGAAGDWMHEETYAAVEAAVRKLAGGA